MRAVQSCQFRQPTLRVLRDRSPTNVAVVAWQRLIVWSHFDLPDVHSAGLLVDPLVRVPVLGPVNHLARRDRRSRIDLRIRGGRPRDR